MTTNLTETEREVWKTLYLLHEEMHDMEGTDSEWVHFARKVGTISDKYAGSEKRLADKLLIALYSYFSDEQKIRQDDARFAPEQVSMEDIPWN